MPELPEVETIRLGLLQTIKGKEIGSVKALWAKSLKGTGLAKLVAGQKIKDIRRRGKVLIIDLANKHSLMIHLKMTGQLVYEEKQQDTSNKEQTNKEKTLYPIPQLPIPALTRRFAGGHPTKSMGSKLPDASTRVVFTLKDGSKLFFNDQRKFGWIKLVPTAEVELDSLLSRMGPEPLLENFTLEDFITRLQRRKAPIKAVLLDQTTLAGLGNIYVDEALHLAKIHPLRQAVSLSPTEVKRLHSSIIEVLKAALGYGGTSFTNYINALGVKGNYLDYARVFRKDGQPCPVCETPIQKIRVAGRGTHVCQKCQRI